MPTKAASASRPAAARAFIDAGARRRWGCVYGEASSRAGTHRCWCKLVHAHPSRGHAPAPGVLLKCFDCHRGAHQEGQL
eukprot:1161874-Pelagomonas_calceolata.AAC.1